jgi:alanine dehydrogenase
MIIACPKESKSQEHRVGLTPDSVQSLVNDGHEVWIESGAGAGIGNSDADYVAAGARIGADLDSILEPAELVVKVKEPNAIERSKLTAKHTLFTYLHLASDPDQTQDLIKSNAICIAYETVTGKGNSLPLLTPMSAIAGRLSVQEAAGHLLKHRDGRGVLLSGAPGIPSEKVVVIGGGVVGSNAARIALGLGGEVTILDRSETRLEELREQFKGQVHCEYSDAESIARHLRQSTLVIGAVLIPGRRADYVISSDMVREMIPGSVIADVAIDQGGCCENSRPTTHADPVFVKDGVIHYCVANIPGAVPVTSSRALNHVTLPFVRELANKGIKKALGENSDLLNGLNVCRGAITNTGVAEAQNLNYVAASEALAAL